MARRVLAKAEAPPNAKAWDKSVKQVLADLEAMRKLIADPNAISPTRSLMATAKPCFAKRYW